MTGLPRRFALVGVSLLQRESFILLTVPVHHRGHVLRRARREHRIDVAAVLIQQVQGRRAKRRRRLLQPV